MNRVLSLSLLPLAFAAPAAAQTMPNMAMPGMSMPMKAQAAAKPVKVAASHKKTRPARRTRTRRSHAAAAPAMADMPGMGAKTQPQAAHDMSSMPGMKMPAAGAGSMKDMPGMSAAAPAGPAAPATPRADMAGMKGMAMPATGQAPGGGAAIATQPDGSEPEIPAGPPPPPPTDHGADRFFDPAAMAAARATLQQEHGGLALSKVMASLFEYQARARGGDGYRWDGQAWFGGDLNRFVLKSEGEGSRRDGVGNAEVQALYSHAIGPYFNVEGGVRQDVSPRARTYATVGVEGLAPYWFDVQGALFLSTQGELLGRAEATYDLRLSQRLILQPRAELNLAAQDTRETRTGSGLSNAELGLRLRYEVTREFAPYIGVSYDHKFSKTASYARAIGEDSEATSFVVGVRAWF
jgi:copper resistance protein B